MSPLASLPRSVLGKLTAVRRRRRLLAILQAGAWTLAGLALLGLGAALLPEGPAAPWVRVAARLWIGLCLLLPALFLVVPVWRRTADLLGVARAVDDRVASTGDSLLTAVDLSRALDAGRLDDAPESARLARKQLAEADALVDGVDPEQLLPISGLHASTLLGPGLGIALLALLVGAPDAARRGWDALFGPVPVDETAPEAADAERVDLILRNVRIKLEPPAYSGRSELVLEGTTGDIVALPGTRVTLEAQVPGSGSGVLVVLEGQEETPTRGDVDDGEAVIAFVTGDSTRYQVQLERSLGRDPLRSRWFLIEVLPDRPPELEVAGPPGTLRLSAGEEAPFNIRASDDFALSRLEQVAYVGGREVHRAPIAPVEGEASHEAVLRWDPAVLGGEGGEVSLVIEAWDNDTVNGPKVTASEAIQIRVPTPEDQRRQIMALKRQLQETLVDLLADLLVSHAYGLAQTRRADVLADHGRQAALAQLALSTGAELLQQMALDETDRTNHYAGILQLLQNIDVAWSPVVEFAENTLATETRRISIHPVDLQRIQDLRGEAITEIERAILDLGVFIDMQQGRNAQARMASVEEQLANAQELLRRAEQGEPVDQEMEAALQELERRMAELAKELSQRSPGPDEGFQNQMPGEMSKSTMETIRELIRQGRHEEAMEMMQRAQDALARMQEQMGKESERLAGNMDTEKLQEELAEAIAKAEELEKQQEQVVEQLEQLEQQFADPAQQERMQELRSELEALEQELGQVGTQDPMSRDPVSRAASRARRDTQRAAEALDQGSPEEAAWSAREAEARLRESARDARTPESAEQAQQLAKRADRIADQLEEMQAQQKRQQAQAQRAGQPMGEQQGQVAEGTEQLQQQMGEMGGSAFNPAQARQSLENAGEMMRRSQAQLGQGDPQRAGSAARDGLNQLRQFRQGLQQAQQALQSQGSGQSGQMAGAPRPGGQSGRGRGEWDSMTGEGTGEVEMPEADEFVGPEAWRALLQEGAQGDAPDRYKPLNGSYFEELVK